jgi:hypothetical protein
MNAMMRMILKNVLPLMLGGCAVAAGAAGAGPPEKDFVLPPDSDFVLPPDSAWIGAFMRPPLEARPWCYWWWLNGAASKEGITRDFEEMRKQGISGALLFDAGEAGPPAPRGPKFMSDEWRDLYKWALHEADRCGIVLTVNLCSGWNAGGSWVTPEHAAKKLVSTQTLVKGPGRITVALPQPATGQGFYRDIAVLAAPIDEATAGCKLIASSQYESHGPALAEDGDDESRWVSNGGKPGMGPTPEKPEFLQFDFPEPTTAAGLFLKPYADCGPKDVEVQGSDDGQTFRPLKRFVLKPRDAVTLAFDETRAKHFRIVFRSSHPYRGENWNVQVAEVALLSKQQLAAKQPPLRPGWDHGRVVDVTQQMNQDGQLNWDVAAGTWRVLRLGYTLHGNATKCVGGGPSGLEIDPMSAAAMDAHFAETGAKLIADAGPLAGKALQYFHIDSWELGQPTWTPDMRREFTQRRGYDPLPFLPAILGQTVDNDQTTRRFLADYRRTAADLVAANYYGRLRELTVKGGLRGTHPESGGPFFTHWIDALQCEGINDIPMGEFWKRMSEPAGEISAWPPHKNPSVKQAASAAHIYGKPICQAEAFTDMGAGDWTSTPWTMKDIGDQAFCHGLTRYVLCFWIHQPNLHDIPGYQWVNVGTHFDSNITWWPMSRGWLTYISRCQYLLRQGRFVADFAYFQGEQIPGFIAPRDLQQPLRPAGFDYDALNAEVLLNRATAKDGRLVLPDGMSYRYLVLPHDASWSVSPVVLRKIKELAEAGVTIIGPRPTTAPGLTDYPRCDEQVKELADACWGPETSVAGKKKAGSGRVIWGHPLADIVQSDGLAPDVAFRNVNPQANLDWIHRRGDDGDIYFLSNQSAVPVTAEVEFRVSGKQPELWDAVTGQIRNLPEWSEEAARTIVPLEFAPRESYFVVFRNPARPGHPNAAANFPKLKSYGEVAGPWQVSFDPKWGGPESLVFEKLDDWTTRPEAGVRHYSGTATYRQTFDLPAAIRGTRQSVFLDLGRVENLAAVRLNGKQLGVVWTAPWHVEITAAMQPTGNKLEIDVANLWPNRLIGDAALPPEQRFTVTNVRKTYQSDSPLLPSGLLGPVRLMAAE